MSIDSYLKKIPTWLSVLTLLGVMFGTVKYVVNSETSGLRQDISNLNHEVAAIKDRLDKNEARDAEINKRIDDLLGKVFDKVVPSIGVKPTHSQLEKTNAVVVMAQTAGVKLNVLTLARYGTIVAHASENPATADIAWPSLKQAVDYRTFLNKDFIATPKDLTVWPDKKSSYRPSVIIGSLTPSSSENQLAFRIFFAGGIVKSEYSARLEKLSEPQPTGSEIGIYVIEGGSQGIILDGMYMKNVIVRNMEISYGGGPVRLENVSFVNCRFVLTKNRPTINLGEAILEANSVNYSTVAPS